MRPIATRDRGLWAEDQACLYLERHGLRVVERNFRLRRGEIDIVAQDDQVLVFVEVRWRNRLGDALASIGPQKRSKIRLTAQWILQHRFGGLHNWPPCRFDVIAIDPNGLQWVPNAFSLTEDFS